MTSAPPLRLGPEAVYRRRPDVVARQIAGETLLVPIRGNVAEMDRVFSLNGTAAFIWKTLDGARTVEEILALLVREFDVPPETAAEDLSEFLEDACAAAVAERVEP